MFIRIRKIFISILLIGLSVTWVKTNSAQEIKSITLKLGTIDSVKSPANIATNRFAEWISQKTDGKVKVEVYPASQLGYSVSQIESIMAGALEMGQFAVGFFPPYMRDWEILTLAFAFKDRDHLKRFLASQVNQYIKDQFLKQYGVRVLVENWLRPPHVIATAKPVRKLDDLKGLKIRVPNIEMYLQNWKQLGASPTLIAWEEVYTGLRQGVVEGVDLPFDFINVMRIYEVAPHITMTNHLLPHARLIINESVYQKLPGNVQKALIEAGKETGDFYTQLEKKVAETDREELLKINVKICEIDTAPFRERMAILAKELEAKNYWKPGLYDNIQALRK